MLKRSECSKLKPYNIQDLVFSSIRSKVAYKNRQELKDLFRFQNNEMEYLTTHCNKGIKGKISKIIDQIKTNDVKVYSNGFVIWKENTIYVTFRGIVSSIDWLTATNMNEIAWDSNNHPRAFVHGGFYSYFLEINDELEKDIKQIMDTNNIERIVFSGHSMGGALAILASTFYAAEYRDLVITCHTFGTPAIGNDNFITLFEDNVDDFIRLEYDKDIVPKLPLNTLFKHISNGIVLNDTGYYSCSINNNTVLTYEDILNYLCFPPNIYNHHDNDIYFKTILNIKTVSDV